LEKVGPIFDTLKNIIGPIFGVLSKGLGAFGST